MKIINYWSPEHWLQTPLIAHRHDKRILEILERRHWKALQFCGKDISKPANNMSTVTDLLQSPILQSANRSLQSFHVQKKLFRFEIAALQVMNSSICLFFNKWKIYLPSLLTNFIPFSPQFNNLVRIWAILKDLSIACFKRMYIAPRLH